MSDKIKMTVEMEVTPSQALALEAFFKTWNSLSVRGCSRYVGFYVDGDGNFKPKCNISYDKELPCELTDEIEAYAKVFQDTVYNKNGKDIMHDVHMFDFDNVGYYMLKNGIKE